MNAYTALIRMNLRLVARERAALFFNYIFPLIFFFVFAQVMHAERGGMVNQVVNMVLTIGVMGSGLFGAGMRAVTDREQNILRRFKVAPISPMPLLVGLMVTGAIHFLPVLAIIIGIAHFAYGMAIPERWPSLVVFLLAGVWAFRAIGLIVAAVVNSMQESGVLTQILYLPMMFLSGATFPTGIMPVWVQTIAQFLPATHFFSGLQSILGAREPLSKNLQPFFALALCGAVGLFIADRLFRWEKGDKVRPQAKAWVVGVLAPFLLLGVLQANSKQNVAKNRTIERKLARSGSLLIKNVRIFVGNGQVIENGSVLVRNGVIDRVLTGPAPDGKALKAAEIEGAGKTLLPGLIDAHVHLSMPGGVYENQSDYMKPANVSRALAAYLYSGVTAVKSAGDPLDITLRERARVASGERLGAELFLSGPMFTTEGGHGTQYFRSLPQQVRTQVQEQMVRMPKTAGEAQRMVDDLAGQHVDAIKALLESGFPGQPVNRMDAAVLNAIVAEARARKLPAVVHTAEIRDIEEALAARANGLEHGSARDVIPTALLERIKANGASYDPTLAVMEAIGDLRAGNLEPYSRSLVQQVAPPGVIDSTRKMLGSRKGDSASDALDDLLATGSQNLLNAYRAGCMLVAGTDSGNMLLVHGPAIHRELQLWVKAGVPPAAALQAATYNAARLLGVESRMGSIQKGREATLVVVDGNPLEDITATERISGVMLKGERIARSELFKQE